MTFWKLVGRSLSFHRRANTAVLCGAMIGTAVLVGALVTGDSVRYSLRRLAFERLGKAEFAVLTEERFFRYGLGDELSEALGATVAPVLGLRGIASAEGGLLRANQVQVFGVDGRFFSIGGAPSFAGGVAENEAVVNQKLALKLGLAEGDELLLRIGKADVIPGDMPFSSGEESTVPLRLRVKGVASDREFGNFSLRANQAVPLNVYLSLGWLGEKMALAERANVLLVAKKTGKTLTLEAVEGALNDRWRLADAGLELRRLSAPDLFELRSERVFLEQPVADWALGLASPPEAAAANGSGSNRPFPRGILTYFVNEIHSKGRSTPYSFVSAPGEPIVPPDLRDGEIVFNEWLADDLGAVVGDSIELVYFVPGSMRNLEEARSTFTVRSIIPLSENERELVPDFPGIAAVQNCRDWDPGIPIDLGRIRPRDERYWNRYGGTPKAFVTQNAARRMWANRFGSLTAVRFEGGEAELTRVSGELRQKAAPSALGVRCVPVRREGVEAGMGAVDFGQLFLGLSFFIILASLILTSLLFAFAVERRSEEAGTLMALGFDRPSVRRIFLAEGCVLALAGSVLGTGLGLLYNQALLYGLGTVWRGAVGTSALRLHVKPVSVSIGVFSGLCVSALSMWIVTLNQRTASIVVLQRSSRRRGRFRRAWFRLLAAGVFVIGIFFVLAGGGSNEGAGSVLRFFVAGTLLLAGCLALFDGFLLWTGDRRGRETIDVAAGGPRWRIGVAALGLRNCARKRGRSLAVTGLIASGIFIVISVSANRSGTLPDGGGRESGTGGFAYYGETAVPVLYDMNSVEGRKKYGLIGSDVPAMGFVQFRVRDGDDASCLNLNRIEKPRILGVRSEELAERGSFSFEKTAGGSGGKSPWLLLEEVPGDGSVPAIADQNVLTWGLHKSVGETIAYTDERGQGFELRFVGGLRNSIFQGSVLISEGEFLKRFPSTSGGRVLLVDIPGGGTEGRPHGEVRALPEILLRAFRDFGLELTPASQRLADFNTVQNTYLSIFLLLGGLGLILGSFGMGLVVLRNVLERRSELAILRALGFGLRRLKLMLLAEHGLLVGVGALIGAAASAVAAIPVLSAPGSEAFFTFAALIFSAVVVCGFGWTCLAAAIATRGSLVPALRNE